MKLEHAQWLRPHTASRAEFNNSLSREQLIQSSGPGSEKFATELSSA